MAGRVRASLLAFALLAVTTPLAPPATAHTGDPTIVARVDAVVPAIEGVTVEVRSGVADQLFVVNTTDDAVEVLGANGQPFLRIGKVQVLANVRSQDWLASLSPFGTNRVAIPGADWRVVARHGSWGWFDHRLHDSDRAVTPALRDARTPVRLADWKVPLRHAGTTHTVQGHVEYRPVRGAFRSRTTAIPPDMTVEVLDGRVPGLFVRWRGTGTITLKGIEGEPFARFNKSGIEVNAASATWHDDRGLRGQADPRYVNLGNAPRWVRHGGATLTWLDRRLAYTPGVPSADALRRSKPTTMVEWEVPADVDGRATRIAGETTWYPNDTDDDRLPTILVLAATAVAAAVTIAGAVFYRRWARGSRP